MFPLELFAKFKFYISFHVTSSEKDFPSLLFVDIKMCVFGRVCSVS